MTSHLYSVIAAIVGAFGSFAIAIAGIATITSDCYANYLSPGNYWYKGYGPEVETWNQNCVEGLQFQWWGVWFEFIVLGFIVGFILTKNLESHASTLTGLLATVTAINMVNSWEFMQKSGNEFTANQYFLYSVAIRQAGLNCAAAGYVMFCAFNLILILLLGSGFVWFGNYGLFGGKPSGASAALERGPPATFTPVAFAAPAYSPRPTGEVTQ